MKDKYTFSVTPGAKKTHKIPNLTLQACPWNGQKFSMAEDRVMTCREKSPSLQTITGGSVQELKTRAYVARSGRG